jgi:putative transposase
VIRLVVLMYVRFPLSLRNVEDLLFELRIKVPRLKRGIVLA